MKATIEISEETMDRLSAALNLPPLYGEECVVDEDGLSYAIRLLLEQICAD